MILLSSGMFATKVTAVILLVHVTYCNGLMLPSATTGTISRIRPYLYHQQSSSPSTLYSSLSSSSSNKNDLSDEMIRQDIESMREEAKLRLQTLHTQMDDMIRKHNNDHDHDAAPTTTTNNNNSNTLLDASSFENNNNKNDLHEQVHKIIKNSSSNSHKKKSIITVKNIPAAATTTTRTRTTTRTPIEENPPTVVVPPPSAIVDSTLLQDTRWKAVIRVGSVHHHHHQQQQVTASEDSPRAIEKPLMLHLVIDFSSEPLQEQDKLLQGTGGQAKKLQIKESWIGAASLTEGRQRNVNIKTIGGWKVLPGQGPKGIDILRFYIDATEEICHDPITSTLRLPAKRIYCTSGIFAMDHHNESEIFKDYLRTELEQLVHKYEDLMLEKERDERIFSFDGIKRAKQMMDLKSEIKLTNQKITQARIRDPEKSMLRLSRRRDIGVTREGQVCYHETHDNDNDNNNKKNKKGASSEYLVLGKCEMASIDKPLIETPSRKEEDVSNELRP